MMKYTFTIGILAALSTAALAGAAMSDKTFATKAAIASNSEVAEGKVAQAQGSRAKALGARMVQDHSAAGEKLAAIVRSEGMTPSTSLGVAGTAELAKLKMLHGAAFDSAYIKDEIGDHQKTIALLQGEIANGTDPKLKAWAQETLPTVQRHLTLFQQASGSSSSSM